MEINNEAEIQMLIEELDNLENKIEEVLTQLRDRGVVCEEVIYSIPLLKVCFKMKSL